MLTRWSFPAGRSLGMVLIMGLVLVLTRSSAGATVQGLVAPAPFVDLQVRGISGDGHVVYGILIRPQQKRAFRWTATDGLRLLDGSPDDTPAQSTEPLATSHDGSVVVGYRVLGERRHAVRWTAHGRHDLLAGHVHGETWATGVSRDGRTVIGQMMDGAPRQPFCISSDGAVLRLRSGEDDTLTPIAVADDGRVIGYGRHHGQSDFFQADEQGHVTWLEVSPGGSTQVRMQAASINGGMAVGFFVTANGTHPCAWSPHLGISQLNTSSGHFIDGWATAVAANGTAVAGYRADAGGPGPFVWTAQTGAMVIRDLLPRAVTPGDLTGWELAKVTGISADGRTIVGTRGGHGGRLDGWIVRLAPEDLAAPTRAAQSRKAMLIPSLAGAALLLGWFMTTRPGIHRRLPTWAKLMRPSLPH